MRGDGFELQMKVKCIDDNCEFPDFVVGEIYDAFTEWNDFYKMCFWKVHYKDDENTLMCGGKECFLEMFEIIKQKEIDSKLAHDMLYRNIPVTW